MAATGEKAKGKVFSLNVSSEKGVPKEARDQVSLRENFGLVGDAHGGPGLRQVSLLAIESIRRQTACPKVKQKGLTLAPGDFAENITTEGLELAGLTLGDRLKIKDKIILEITKIGKECHKYCAIYKKIGDCIMPREGIFARVVKGGEISRGDAIEVIKHG